MRCKQLHKLRATNAGLYVFGSFKHSINTVRRFNRHDPCKFCSAKWHGPGLSTAVLHNVRDPRSTTVA